MAGYQKLDILLREEIDQLTEEGRIFDKQALLEEIDKNVGNREGLKEIYKKMCAFPKDASFPYNEPDEYEEILPLCKGKSAKYEIDENEIYNKIYGAWLARCIGCALGQPVELWNASSIKAWLEGAGKYPLSFYIPTHSEAEKTLGYKVGCINSTDEHISFMQTDDDLRYTVLALKLLMAKGEDFDSYDVGLNWHYNLPYRALCTAENQAYLNFAAIDENGPWGKPANAMELLKQGKVNTFLNPYREWIGAQIRIDGYAYACAGDPHKAAYLAYKDAYFSHTANGIYGAMFFAAMIASAFGSGSIEKAFEDALCEIPATSRLYEAMLKTREIVASVTDFEELIQKVNAEFANYNCVHTINNAAVCVAALLWSKGDFEKALTFSVMAGLDTDCNGATVGSCMGALLGEKAIPDKWKAPLHDTLYSGLADFHPIKISEIARMKKEVYDKIKG